MIYFIINNIYIINITIHYSCISIDYHPKIYISCIRMLFGIEIINYIYIGIKNLVKLIKKTVCYIKSQLSNCCKNIISYIQNNIIYCKCKLCVKNEINENKENKDVCSICLESLNTNIIKLQCGHYLHKDCKEKLIKSTLLLNNSVNKKEVLCPLCRQPLTLKETNVKIVII